MALLTEIIKKYECEGKKRIAEAQGLRKPQAPAAPVSADSVWTAQPAAAAAEGDTVIDIGTKPPQMDLSTPDPTPQDVAYFDWQNKLVDFYKNVKNAVFIMNELQNCSSVLAEMDRLRNENLELKEKLKQLQG
jgi:hypothetical protein